MALHASHHSTQTLVIFTHYEVIINVRAQTSHVELSNGQEESLLARSHFAGHFHPRHVNDH